MDRFNAYDVDRACDLVEGFRDTLKGESRRLVNLALDLIQAGAESESNVRDIPACGDPRAQAGAAA